MQDLCINNCEHTRTYTHKYIHAYISQNCLLQAPRSRRPSSNTHTEHWSLRSFSTHMETGFLKRKRLIPWKSKLKYEINMSYLIIQARKGGSAFKKKKKVMLTEATRRHASTSYT